MPLLADFLGMFNGGQAPYQTDQYGQVQGGGLLGKVGAGLQNNSDSLLGFGMGMLGGKDIADGFQNASQSYQRGSVLDRQRTIDLRNQIAAAARKKAAEEFAKANPQLGSYAGLMGEDPELASKMAAAQYQKQLNPDNPLDDALKRAQIGNLTNPQPSQTERLIQQLPEADRDAARRASLGMTGVNDYNTQVLQRKQQAEQLGLKPDDPRYQAYVLTGKMPKEDAQPMTATDKKFIMEADDGVMAAQTAIQNLQQAKVLSKSANSGFAAGTRGYLGSLVGDKAGQATVELDNLVTTNALGQMKAIFGGNPTEGEREILLKIQGSSSLPDAERQKIYDRAIMLAERRLKLNQQRANQLRGGDFYKQGGGMSFGDTPPVPEAPQQAPDPLGIR